MTTSSPGPTAYSTCSTWPCCTTSSGKSGSAREITTARSSCSPRPLAARHGSDRFTLLISLYDLALASQAQGDLRGAAGHLAEGRRIAAAAGDQASAAYYLEALADVARLQDNPQRAVRLLAAAAAVLEASGSGWLHAWVPRAPHGDDALAVLRSRPGGAAFDDAWARGRSIAGQGDGEIALDGS